MTFETRNAEQAPSESEFFFKESQRAAAIGSYKFDLITGTIECSEIMDNIFGIDKNYSRSVEGWLDVLHPDDRDMMGRYLKEEVMAKGKPFDKEYRIIRINDGETRWVHGLGEVIIDNGTLSSLIGTVQDITERKLAEIALHEIKCDLDRAQEVGKIGSWRLDVRSNVLTWSDESYRIYGIPKGTPLTYELFLSTVHPDDREYVDTKWKSALRGEPYDIEHRIVVDGQLKWIREKAYLEFEKDGSLIGGFGITQDITKRKVAEEELLKANDELEQRVAERTMELADTISHLQAKIKESNLAEISLRKESAERLRAVEALRENEQMLIHQSRQAAMGEMINNIAHQWRQPLNTLGLEIQQLLLFYDQGEFDREFLENGVKSSMELIKHMSETIDDFRNYFKPDKEKAEFKVHEAIVNSLSLLEGSLQPSKINIEIIPKDDPVICGFQNEFAQVLINIVNNAKDALNERKISDPRVAINLFREKGSAIVTITDNAGGIPDEILEKVFDPYFTTKGQQGTGVGLFMSKAIIEKNMGGRLSVRNVADGAEFRVEVPGEPQTALA